LDSDGCPENIEYTIAKDFDKDGIFDHDDSCPFNPETYNNFDDLDGCPDIVAVHSGY
jgi:hypothetical protein